MKKAFMFAAALLFVLLMIFPALAEDLTPTYQIGEGKTEILVIVTEAKNMEEKINVFIRTNETNLMDALTRIDFIDVEKASWGYYVTSVLGVQATGNEYWSILEYCDSSFLNMSEPIRSKMLRDGDVYAFILF